MLFKSFELKNIKLKNRVVMPPMCMYSAKEDGIANDFHFSHYASRAIGGVGLIICESTAVLPDGRITLNDLGIWSDEHVAGLKQIVSVIHQFGSVAGIQINHAGRKAKVEHPKGPSSINYGGDYQLPEEMTIDEIKEVILAFKDAARRADQAGFDLLEIHGAHGYLIFQFLSPLSNQRTDEYKDGVKFLYEVVEAISEVWPKEKVLALRVSANEYVEHGVTPKMISEAINRVKHLGLDLIDVSSGGNVLVKIPAYPGYQLPFSREVKELTGLPTIGGGLITGLELAEHAVSSKDCDLVYMGRVLLREPYLVINYAKELNVEIDYPEQYKRGKKS
ncbi:MAG: NADH:flavin oxidoreductase/NADH oxidase [Acholeplasmataceae bacterium]|jgi:NADPH2 dehydrogenase|nr:NADH:flavin oxidoreductase/NADH oxidase [Acholeplasmataceae bacterium]